MRPPRLVLGSLVVGVVLTGCGVPLSDGAQPIPGASRLSPSPASTPSPAVTATSTATIWFVDKGRLVPRATPSPSPVTAASALELLGQAPAGSSGLVTLIADPVGGPPLATLPTAPATPESAGTDLQRVVLSPTFSELSAEEQVLLIGQVVLTLTEIDPTPVLFSDAAGAALSVPLPDGRLRDGAVTRGDYVALT